MPAVRSDDASRLLIVGNLFVLAVVAAGLVWIFSLGAGAEERFAGRIVPVMIVSADYQERADRLDYKHRFDSYLGELDEWFEWSTGGLAFDRVEPQFLSVPFSNNELWCSDVRSGLALAECDADKNRLAPNIDHLLNQYLGVQLRPETIGAGSPAPWVLVWGGAGYAGEPMVGERAFYAYMNDGSCDGVLAAFDGDDPADHCAKSPRGSWVGSGLGSSIHELAHQTWDLSHPTDLPKELARPSESRPAVDDPSGQLMSTPSQFPAVGWADYEIDMIEGLDARYFDLEDPTSPISHVETSTYVTGEAKPAFPSTPHLKASREGSGVRLHISAADPPAEAIYRIFALGSESIAAGQERPLVALTSSIEMVVRYRHAACFVVMAWSPDHRPSMPSPRWDACVDVDPATPLVNHAPSLALLAPQESDSGRPIEPVVVTASDRDGDNVTVTFEDLPPGLAFDEAARQVTGTPQQGGIATVRVTVHDGRGQSSQQQFTWTITETAAPTETPSPPRCGPVEQRAGDARLSGHVTAGGDRIDERDRYASIDAGVGDLYVFDDRSAQSSIYICANVETDGRYVVFGSTIAPDSTSDSFFVRIDGGEVFPWHLPQSTVWRRNVLRRPASAPMILDLSAGAHIIEFFHREDGVKMEMFELVKL